MRRSELVRVALGVLFVVLCTWGGPVAGLLTGDQRLDPETRPEVFPVAVQIELGFEAGRFHRQLFSAYGTYDGRNSTASSIRLVRVSEDSLHALSRYYWIDEIVVVEG